MKVEQKAEKVPYFTGHYRGNSGHFFFGVFFFVVVENGYYEPNCRCLF